MWPAPDRYEFVRDAGPDLEALLHDNPNNNQKENTMNKTEIRARLIKYLLATGCWDVDEVNDLLKHLGFDPIEKEVNLVVTYSVTVEYEGVQVVDHIDTDGLIDYDEALRDHLGDEHWVAMERACESGVDGEIQDVTVTYDPEVV